ncbi:TetR/AcrR family transcriptional regulator [Sporomusa acidovorans]|uniref:HTH-type transcriptional regulator BetI n=1 Tax=Sporomusa acidovorans (strain ATCC 49682 / DSM 3132 / Mol) TaxID=1123286 RepID=A0ABZ3J4R5_SPOA4|nr:TetR/AcrR family transcriptional regulator [Sporomusa acidovorans]OZC23513.1 HTH-type transcriptional repressor KstR2 [Sporomusa acidovorans DSM 3132]SDF47681.1 transcriptional regulator, TetR family [Sporomusa acidovorans]
MARTPQDPQIRIDEILDTAEPLFAANGYRKTTIQDITDKMGVAKGMIYYYFKSKDEILEALINRQLSVLLTDMKNIACSNIIRPPQKMEFMINAMFRTAQYKDGLILNSLYDEKNLYLKNKISRQGTLLLKPLLLKVIEDGIQKDCFHVANPAIAINFIMSTLQCITDALCEKTSNELIACHLNIAESIIEKILALPENTLHLSLE